MDQVQVTPEVPMDSPEYVAQMAALGEQAVKSGNTQISDGEPGEIPAKPDWVPDKFYDAATGEVNYEALSKSYQELEKKQSNKEPATPETPPADDKSKEGEGDQQDVADKAVQAAGLNMADLSKEYSENGVLADTSYEALEKAGIPRETVDQYIAGQAALAQQARAQAFSITEGEESYHTMTSWAKNNLSQAELETYNKSVNSANQGVREMAVRGLWAKYTSESGQGKALVHGKGSASESTGYKSNAEIVAAMSDPRYAKDPAYRKAVEAKMAVTKF
jgi:hypothetical protein